MSDIQKGMVLLSILNPETATYHAQFVHQIPCVDVALFEKALELLAEKHEILRTHFEMERYSKEVQFVDKSIEFKLEQIDLQELSAPQQEAAIEAYLARERQRPFDVRKAPIWRAAVCLLNDKSGVFIFQYHHAILDGWSIAALSAELFDFYVQLQENPNFRPAKLQARIKDAIIEEATEKKNQKTIQFWKEELADYNRLEIFEDVAVSDRLAITYEGSFLQQLKRRSMEDGLSLKSIFFACLVYALNELQYADDLVVGMVSSNRPFVEDGDKLLGCFLNSLPIRVRLDQYADNSWQEYAQAVEQYLVDLKGKDRLTLYEISRIAGEKNRQENPFFDVIFNYVDFYLFNDIDVAEEEQEKKEEEEKLSIDSYGVTNTYLDITADVRMGSLGFQYGLKRKLRAGLSLEMIHSYVDRALKKYLEEPRRNLFAENLLSAAQKSLIKNDFNNTTTNYPTETLLDVYAWKQSDWTGKTALIFGEQSMTFAGLEKESNQWQAYLQDEHQIKKGDFVGIRLERCLALPSVILGILKCGAAYVPIDVHHPQDRIDYIREDCGFQLCIDAKEVQTFRAKQSSLSASPRLIDVGPTDAAYAIYTSGSTGQPKGVVNSHGGLYNRLCWMRDDLGIDEEDIFLQKTPYTFDVSVWELNLLWMTGASLVLAKPEGHKDPLYLQELIAQQKISIIHFVPSMLGAFLPEVEVEKCQSLRHIVCSGEALPATMVQQVQQKLKQVCIHNYYGPTEAAIDVTAIDLTKVDLDAEPMTIGCPVANTKIYLIDKRHALQAIGVPGELLITGIQVAQGYLNRPSLNQEKFIDNPFGDGMAYRTGDLARWLPDGQIEYLGRMDQQVKIRGNRIELGEIEQVMESSEAVRQAVVMARTTQSGAKQLVAYLLGEEGYLEAHLREALQAKLPDYMIPSHIIALDEFPLTSSGKVNRKLLPDPLQGQANASTYEAAQNEMEKQLVELWEKVLGHAPIGTKDGFFQIGGDSILSIRIISRVNRLFETELKVGQLYQADTVQKLATLIKSSAEQSKLQRAIRTEIEQTFDELKATVLEQTDLQGQIVDAYPMSDIQKGMVLLSDLQSEEGWYQNQYLFQVPKINPDIFDVALRLLAHKHETLRSSFDLDRFEEGVQLVHKQADFSLRHIDLCHLDVQAQNQSIQDFLEEGRRHPIDPFQAPLWRPIVFDISPEESIFLLQFHHAILDGWSLASMNTELFHIYQALEYQPNFQPQALQTTCREAVLQEWMNKRDESVRAYWMKALDGYKRLDIFTNQPASKRFEPTYDASFSRQLQERAKADGLPLKSLLFASFAQALQLLTYERELVVGMVANNRPATEDGDKVLGCFLNTLPVRVQFPATTSQSCRQYLQDLHQQLREISTNGRLSLLEIASSIGERVTDENPFFDVMFNLMDFHIYNEVELSEEETAAAETDNLQLESIGQTNTFLDLDVHVADGNLQLSYSQYRELRSDIDLQQLHGYVDRFLKAYLDNPETKLQNELLLSESEKQTLLFEFNQQQSTDTDANILDLWNQQLQQRPDQPALVCGDRTFSYAELDMQSSQMARRLIHEQGIGLGDRVGIFLERSETMIVAIWAVLKCGAAYVPIDPEVPLERMEYIREDSECKGWIDADFISDVKQKEFGETTPFPRASADDLAYIIYTSGSSGRAKGVLISQTSLADYALTTSQYFGLAPTDRALQQASISFDTSIEEIFPILVAGGTLYILEDRKDIDGLLACCAEQKISWLSTNPFVISHLNDSVGQYDLSLRILISGGDVLKPIDVNNLLDQFEVYNTYGPTESTVCATYHRVQASDLTSIPIGKPIANRQAYILDAASQLLPQGVAGELCLSGKGLAKGYLNRPNLTAEKFVDHPYHPTQKMYKTGDLTRWLPDGSIEFLGRTDEQVKIRGNRIELKEVEHAILQHPSVENVVLTILGEGVDKQLVAYYVAEETAPVDLREFLKGSLPSYMLPAHFCALDAVPMTPNGKVDKKALPKPVLTSTQPYVGPENDWEEQLQSIWCDLLALSVEQVGIDHNFFELGGHSLKALTLSTRMERAFGFKMKLQYIFHHPTIRELAGEIARQSKGHPQTDDDVHVEYAPIPKAAPSDWYPLSAAQERMFFLHLLDEESLAYNMPQIDRFDGGLDQGKMEKAFHRLMERHEILRTSFHLQGNQSVQRIAESVPFELPVYHGRSDQAEEIFREFVQPFQLDQAPLLRAAVIEVSAKEQYLMLDMHHIISDGVSYEWLFREFLQLYKGEDVPAPRLQYKDYAVWQKSAEQQLLLASEKQFWLKEFAEEISLLQLPWDFSRPMVKTYAGDSLSFRLDGPTTEQLHQLAKENGATIYMMLLSFYTLLLHKLSNQTDIVIGTPVSGRPHADLERMVGLFMNTLPLRQQVEKQESFINLLQRVKEKSLACLEHQRFPYEELINELNVLRDTGRNPLFDALFSYENYAEQELDYTSREESDSIATRISKFDLSLMGVETNGQLFLTFEYATDLFRKETIERFAIYFQRILRAILADPSMQLSEIDLIPQSERRRLMNDFNPPLPALAESETILDLFTHQLVQQPDAIALVAGNAKWTYRELDSKSNQIAAYLQAQYDLQEDQLVGLCLPRTEWLPISLLGILKAGAAYVPIDPNYPEARKSFILEDANCSWVFDEKELSTFLSVSRNYPETTLPIALRPHHLAYVIYTSGSTGKPKGVMLEHRNVTSFLRKLDHKLGFENATVIAATTNVTFDISVLEILGGWCCGKKVVFFNEEELFPEAFVEKLNEERVEVLQLTPSRLQQLETAFAEQAPHSLQHLLVGGEAFPEFLVEALSQFPDLAVTNVYGPTETTIWSTFSKVTADQPIRIGRAFPGEQIFILNDAHKLQAIGVAGEICIGGHGVARGYHNRPELSAQKFIPHPFHPKQRLYKTGDLGYWTSDGQLVFQGRKDHQVKIRGHRIELGEIEQSLLRSVPEMIQVAVVVRERNEAQLLAAFYSVKEPVEKSLLRDLLQDQLPDYMLPNYFVEMEELPLTPSGKINRNALPAILDDDSIRREFVPPANELESQLMAQWKEVLQIHQLGVIDNFFEVGGNSILVVRLYQRIKAHLLDDIRITDLFSHASIRRQAELIASRTQPDAAVLQINEIDF